MSTNNKALDLKNKALKYHTTPSCSPSSRLQKLSTRLQKLHRAVQVKSGVAEAGSSPQHCTTCAHKISDFLGKATTPKAFAGLEASRTFSCTSIVPWKICHQEKTLPDELTVWQCHPELVSARQQTN